jgi:hypothetical protein
VPIADCFNTIYNTNLSTFDSDVPDPYRRILYLSPGNSSFVDVSAHTTTGVAWINAWLSIVEAFAVTMQDLFTELDNTRAHAEIKNQEVETLTKELEVLRTALSHTHEELTQFMAADTSLRLHVKGILREIWHRAARRCRSHNPRGS